MRVDENGVKLKKLLYLFVLERADYIYKYVVDWQAG